MKPSTLPYTRRLITSTVALVAALSAPGHAGVIEFFPATGFMKIDGQFATSIHGVTVTTLGEAPEERVNRYLVRGDLKLLAGAAGMNGTTDVIKVVGVSGTFINPGLRLIVGNDFIAEPGTQVMCNGDASAGVPAGGGGEAMQTPAGPPLGPLGLAVGGDNTGRNGISGLDGWAANFVNGNFHVPTKVVPGGAGGGGTSPLYGGAGGVGAGQNPSDFAPENDLLGSARGAEPLPGANGGTAAGGSAAATKSGLNNSAPLTPGGAAGTAGTLGLGGLRGTRGDYGRGGRNSLGLTNGGDGTHGGDGSDGTAGGSGGNGGHGSGGLHQTSQPELLIGGQAGGPGGSGGAGGGGGSGGPGCGGGGGGGGAYAFPGISHDNGSGSGGGGGEGGKSGAGGPGGGGGNAGKGGRGGGAISIIAYGKIRAWGSFSVAGEGGGFGTSGSTGSDGQPGLPGGQGAPGGLGIDTGSGDGGHGGSGGHGGAGARGGNGGNGGHGGGGAGGTLMLIGATIDCSQGTLNTRGGLSPAGETYNGQDGRFVAAQSAGAPASWASTQVSSGQTLRRADLPSLAPRAPNVFNGMFATPRIALTNGSLTVGASPYGLMPPSLKNDPAIAAAISAAPPGARSLLLRYPGPPQGVVSPSAEFELLILVNFSNQPLTAPKLGLRGLSGFRLYPLKELGFARETLFGGSGDPVDITTLEAGEVYAAMVSSLGSQWDVGFGHDGKVWRKISYLNTPLYDVDGPNILSAESLGYVPSAKAAGCVPASNGWAAGIMPISGALTMSNGPESINVVRPPNVDLKLNTFFYSSGFQRLAGATISAGIPRPIYWDSPNSYMMIQPAVLAGNTIIGGQVLAMEAGVISTVLSGYALTNNGERALRWDYSIFGNSIPDLHARLPGGYSNSRAVASANFGEVVVGTALHGATLNFHGFIWYSGGATMPLAMNGLTSSSALGVAPGCICGWATTTGADHRACVWNYDGTNPVLIHPDGFVNSEATACNGHFIVGRGLDSLGYEHALIWISASKDAVLDLTDLVTDWRGVPVPTAIDANNNITVCTGNSFTNTTWWLAAPRTDIFQIVKIFKPDYSTATVAWASQAGVRYQLWQTPNLSAGPWTKLGTSVTASAPLTLAWDDDAGTNRKFYRVEQLAP